MTRQISIKTKFGWVSACEKKGRIVRIKFRKVKNKDISRNLLKFKFNLNKFINRKNKSINCKVHLQGNYIQRKVWNELKKIKFGETKSYGEIAKKYNLSPRYIGKICGQNKIPLIVPCHRVIKSNGEMGGFSAPGGIKLKRKLLTFEKII